MPMLNIFDNNAAFSRISLIHAIDKMPHVPTRMSEFNLFESKPIREKKVAIENREGFLALIQTSADGAPPRQQLVPGRDIRDFRTVRLAKADTVYAEEFFNIRAFGSESEVMSAQQEVGNRMKSLRRDMDLTKENHMLGAVQGIVNDADGSVIYNWFTEWGLSAPTEWAFDLTAASPVDGALREMCTKIRRTMRRAAKGAWTSGTRVHALCGDQFFDQLIKHKEVRDTYKGYSAAADLRSGYADTEGQFPFGEIMFENYWGTDDGSTVAIATDKVKFFPVGAPGVFQVAWRPGEWMDTVGTLGRDEYPMLITDKERAAWVTVELYSFPLYMCTRPEMLQRGKAGA